MITCIKCKCINPADTIICHQCGAPVEPITRSYPIFDQDNLPSERDLSQHGTRSFGKKKILYLYATTTHEYLKVDPHQPGGVIVGRSDPVTQYSPDVDLLDVQAIALGVSRKHARLVLQNDGLHVVDLNSTNGTHINGLRLPPYQAYILREGDELILGRLKVVVNFAERNAQLDTIAK